MADDGYNGWKNYETWAVGMYLDGNYTGPGTYDYVTELVRGQLSCQHLEGDGVERLRVADYLKDFVETETDPTGYGNDDTPELHPLVSDLLGAALSSVDWHELADAWIENLSEQVA
jgi:hypothetical protein